MLFAAVPWSLLADFVAEVGDQTLASAALIFNTVAYRPLGYSAGLMRYWGRLQRLCGTDGYHWRWPGHQPGKPAQVLGDGCQRELELGSVRPTQS
jgi:hypothetical protein